MEIKRLERRKKITSQIQINKAAKELTVKNKGLEDDKLRESLGMKRLIDVKSTQLEVQKLQNAQKTSQNKLNDLLNNNWYYFSENGEMKTGIT